MDYVIKPIEFHDCLHLKSAVTCLDDQTLLINPDWVDPGLFAGFHLISVGPEESLAANCLPISGTILFPSEYPLTLEKIRSSGFKVRALDFSEFAKAEGALTCCSLIIQ
jgi:dimethylargininase